MATYKFLAIAVVLAIVLPSIATATDYVVGDKSGWTNGFNYTEWAQDKVFTVGDKLVFKYTATQHNVFKVNGTGFKDCIKPPASLALSTGNDIITLSTPGKNWYICGISTHCAESNQKLTINVVGDAQTPAPSPDSSDAYRIFSYGYKGLMAAICMAAVALIMP